MKIIQETWDKFLKNFGSSSIDTAGQFPASVTPLAKVENSSSYEAVHLVGRDESISGVEKTSRTLQREYRSDDYKKKVIQLTERDLDDCMEEGGNADINPNRRHLWGLPWLERNYKRRGW